MADVWTFEKLNSYIKEGIEENIHLDYKAAGSLNKSENKKSEISKDVSAFANSDGGVIIYGISEFQTGPEHLPEKIDPVSRKDFSKESLEQIINSRISPRLHGVVITPVAVDKINEDLVAYVVEIPKGTTAYQAHDKRYYRRFNFESIAMDDWEIKDIINRKTRSAIEIEILPMFDMHYFKIHLETGSIPMKFSIQVSNLGNRVIKYLDLMIVGGEETSKTFKPIPDVIDERFELYFTNEKELKATISDEEVIINVLRDPILPQTFMRIGEIQLLSDFFTNNCAVRITASMDDNRMSKTVRGKEILDAIKE